MFASHDEIRAWYSFQVLQTTLCALRPHLIEVFRIWDIEEKIIGIRDISGENNRDTGYWETKIQDIKQGYKNMQLTGYRICFSYMMHDSPPAPP